MEPHFADEARTGGEREGETETAPSSGAGSDAPGEAVPAEGHEELAPTDGPDGADPAESPDGADPALTPSDVYFPRPYAHFASRMARAVQKHSMYPPAHPALRPAVMEMREALLELIGDRFELTVEVARNQLAIDGVESDPENPQYRSLAGLLHRHQLAAITFFTGVEPGELAELLAAVAREPELSGRPLARAVAENDPGWSGIRLHAIRYEALGMGRSERRETTADDPASASRLWLSLARVAVGGGGLGGDEMLLLDRDVGAGPGRGAEPEETDGAGPEAATGAEPGAAGGGEPDVAVASGSGAPKTGNGMLEPEVLAAVVERRSTEQRYASELVEKLAALSEGLRGGGEESELRRRASRFVSLLSHEALRRVLQLGGDARRRRSLVRYAADWMEPMSMVKLVRAAAGVERKDLSHTCLLMMMKLSRYAGSDDAEMSREAEARLREQVEQLVGEWTVADTIPDQYGEALERMSATSITTDEERSVRPTVEPERVLQMSLELDKAGPRLAAAVTSLQRAGRFGLLFETLDDAPPGRETPRIVWESLERPETVARILEAEEPDFEALDRVLSRVGAGTVPVMLDTLINSESRAVRRQLFSRIGRLGPRAGPHIVQHLDDDHWYVRRNMLALLQSVAPWPDGWSPHEHARDPHPMVRREALKMLLGDRGQRDWAIRRLLEEEAPRSIALGLGAALEDAPPEIVPNLLTLMGEESLSDDLRCMAVRALAGLKASETVPALRALVEEPGGWLRRLLGRPKLEPATPVMLEALASLARHWWHDPSVKKLLSAARRSGIPEVRQAAEGRRGQR